MTRTYIVLALAALLAGCQAASPPDAPGAASQDEPALSPKLLEAQQALDRGAYGKAYKRVKGWLKNHPGDHPEMETALWIKGESLFGRKRFYQAFEAYDSLLNQFATTSRFETVLRREVDVAERLLGGAKRWVWGFLPIPAAGDGLEILQRVEEHWPGSELAAEAVTKQADYYFRKGRYQEAVDTYRILTENYVQSSYYEHALLRLAEATHAQYRGKEYDSTCLDDAIIRYRNFRAAFPARAAEIGVPERIEAIEFERAEKTFETADFYRRTGKLTAARYYWRRIQQRWPESPWAAQSELALQEYAQD